MTAVKWLGETCHSFLGVNIDQDAWLVWVSCCVFDVWLHKSSLKYYSLFSNIQSFCQRTVIRIIVEMHCDASLIAIGIGVVGVYLSYGVGGASLG